MPAAKTIAILQSSYIPWKGYFSLIDAADEFVFYDDAEYSRGDWRNRNRIKTAQGLHWLSIPVQYKGKSRQSINATRIADPGWSRRHWLSLCHAYARAPGFAWLSSWLEPLYLAGQPEKLSEVNQGLIAAIAARLGITTPLRHSGEFELVPGRNERLVSICVQAGASVYLSGPAARAYLDEDLFAAAGIAVQWFDYAGYPEYEQLYPPFVHQVSILDLLAHQGESAREYLIQRAQP